MVETSINDFNKEEKQETVRGLLKQVYSALKELEIYKEFAASDDHSAGTPEEKAIALANKYSVEKEINFSKALLEVYKEHPEYIGEVKSMSK